MTNTENIGKNRNEQGKFLPGVSGNKEGRPIETKEQKIIKKAEKKVIENYIEGLKEALPQISPVLLKQALRGDLGAIKEVHDRVMGRPKIAMDLNVEGRLEIDNLAKSVKELLGKDEEI